MATEFHLYLDTEQSPDDLKSLVMASASFEGSDWRHVKGAISEATDVAILDRYAAPSGPPNPASEPKNGVDGRKALTFRKRADDKSSQFYEETVRCVVALLKSSACDAYMDAFGGTPALLRKDGELILASRLAETDEIWCASRPYVAMFDMPYAVRPLGPWW